MKFARIKNKPLIKTISKRAKGVLSAKERRYKENNGTDARDIDRIIINCEGVNAIVNQTKTDKVEVDVRGNIFSDKDLIFYLLKGQNKLTITVKINNWIAKPNVFVDIKIPEKVFENITVKSKKSAIRIDDVNAKEILIVGVNSDTECYADFEKLVLSSSNGDVSVFVNAKNDVCIDANSSNGNIIIFTGNITKSELKTVVENGNMTTNFKPYSTGRYVLSGNVILSNGDIDIVSIN